MYYDEDKHLDNNDDIKQFTDTITTSTPQLLRLNATETLSLRTHRIEGSVNYIQFCVNLLAVS